jgi:pimeloyl-ACP methyl ester carboxylesterase
MTRIRSAGIVLVAVSAFAVPAAAQAVADTVPPAGVTETPYTFTSGALTLAGTLTMPAVPGPVPVALIVAGSGPTDRNGNAQQGLRTNTYAQLAWGLAQQGIASLRYDKRVLPATQGPVDLTALTFDDFAADLTAAANALARDGRFSKVIVIGHSEGASLAVRAVVRGLAPAGVVLIAGVGRPFQTVIHEQIGRQVDSATVVLFDSALARYLRNEPTGDVPGPLMALLAPVNRTYMRSLVALDPVGELKSVTVPTMIMQGAADLQVGLVDANLLHEAQPDAPLVILPETNHVLKHVVDTLLGAQIATYRDPTLPIVKEVVTRIADWIAGLGR